MAIETGYSILAAPTSVAAGAAVDARSMERKTVVVEGTFTATYQVQISLDLANPPGSTTWVNEGTAITNGTGTGGSVEVGKPCAWVRLNCTAYTSGTPTARLSGFTVL